MTSSSKGLTGNTQPLSSAGNTEAGVQPSKPSVSSEPTPPSTQIMPVLSKPTSTADNREHKLEKLRQQADFLRITVLLLEKNGLIKRYKVLSKPEPGKTQTVREIRLVLSPALWNENLTLKVLSDGTTVAESVMDENHK